MLSLNRLSELTQDFTTDLPDYEILNGSGTDAAEWMTTSSYQISSTTAARNAQDLRRILWTVLGPIILVAGAVGNGLVLATMTRPLMRGTSTAVYLVAMAVLDLAVLTIGLTPHWLDGAEIVVTKNLHPIVCKVEKFLDYSTGDAAVWVRVAFTVDRLIAVIRPLYSGQCCGRPKSARAYIVLATVLAVFKNFHVLWTRGAEYGLARAAGGPNSNATHVALVVVKTCGYRMKTFELFIRPWITFAVVSILPFSMIAVCNTLIIVTLVRRRTVMTKSRRMSVCGGAQNDQQFVQLTAMCVASSMVFLVCTATNIIVLIGRPYWDQPPKGNRTYETVRAVANLLYYVTFSANFFLYCVTGDRFRGTLKVLFWGCFGCFPGEVPSDRRLRSLSTSIQTTFVARTALWPAAAVASVTDAVGRRSSRSSSSVSSASRNDDTML